MQLVILDRDGVVNHDSAEFIKSPDEWVPIHGSLESISRLTKAGYHVIIATNQSGIARGLLDIDTLNRIHNKMLEQLGDLGGAIDAIFFCPHGPGDDCRCRKPRTGLLEEIAARLGIKLVDVPMVGDSLRDLQAARSVGGRAVLVRTGKGEITLADPDPLLDGLEVYDDLAAFTDALLSEPEDATG